MGSPPHVRGKVGAPGCTTRPYGITPACAGKRRFHKHTSADHEDHPRMCGEKILNQEVCDELRGSPPHVRGKESDTDKASFASRITPACAGKRNTERGCKNGAKDHPRMCGEKVSFCISCSAIAGSPPHVRGKGANSKATLPYDRITPACAGKRLKRSRSTVPPVAIVPLFPSVCNKPVVSDGSPAGRDAPLFLPAENAVPASPAYNLRSL